MAPCVVITNKSAQNIWFGVGVCVAGVARTSTPASTIGLCQLVVFGLCAAEIETFKLLCRVRIVHDDLGAGTA